MRVLLSALLLVPGAAFACAMPADMREAEPKLVVDIGPGARLEALFQSIEALAPAVAPSAPAAPVPPPAVITPPPASLIPEAQAPAVPRS